MPATNVSIIGLGWLGLPVAQRLKEENFKVIGSVTTIEKRERVLKEQIDAVVLRLNPEPEGTLSVLLQADALIINIPPRASKYGDDFHPQQVDVLIKAIQQTSCKHIIYTSSTSVYPEINRVVVEEDVVGIEQSAAPNLNKAERIVQQLAPERTVTIVRMGGLMGYDRIPGKYVAGRLIGAGSVPVNYIHRDDAVDILVQLIQQPVAGVFNAVAPEHPSRESIYRKSCADFGYALPIFIEPEQPNSYKVVSSEKIRNQLGYVFKSPDPLQFFYRQ